jgi:hypothetical protein
MRRLLPTKPLSFREWGIQLKAGLEFFSRKMEANQEN